MLSNERFKRLAIIIAFSMFREETLVAAMLPGADAHEVDRNQP